VTATQIPTRMLVLLGAAILVAAAFFVARPILLQSDDSSTATPSTTPSSASTATPTSNGTASTVTAKPVTPKVVLLPGLPTKVAGKLQHSKVIVVSAYAGTSAIDRRAVAAARRGAKDAGTGFVALNVLDRKTARQLQPFMGTDSAPVLLIVRRPGKIVNRFYGVVDDQVVAQAARNAGAKKPASARR
jgi:hypothetical protein